MKHKKHNFNKGKDLPKFQRLSSDQSSVYDSFSMKMGDNYKLIKVLQISWPIYKVEMEVTVDTEPENVLKDIHLILLNLVKEGISTASEIAGFLGLEENDFLLDELYELRRNNLLKYYDEKYVIDSLGIDFISKQRFIPIPESRKYEFCINGMSGEPEHTRDIKNARDEFVSFPCLVTQVGYNFVEENWSKICSKFKADFPKQELTGLSNGRQGIRSKLYFEERYLLVYTEKSAKDQGSARFVLINAFNKNELKSDQNILNSIIGNLKETLFETLEGYEFTSSPPIDLHPLKIKIDKIDYFLPINFKEVDEYLIYALKEGKTVYLEVPRLLKKALKFKTEIENFLKRKDTKLYIVYGVSQDYEHDQNTVKEFKLLRNQYRNFHFIDLPEHIYQNQLDFSGVHRRVIIKDHDFYIETSYNYFTLDFDKKQKISIESATIFTRDVNKYISSIFQLYKLQNG